MYFSFQAVPQCIFHSFITLLQPSMSVCEGARLRRATLTVLIDAGTVC